MKRKFNFEFGKDKNAKLKRERGIGFEDAIHCIQENKVVDVVPHPNQTKYPAQYIFLVEWKSYIYAVPYVQTDDGVFLKTIYPSRKLTKKYLGEKYGKS